MGGLTSAISRLVGPHGTVCSFEASPRIIGYLQQNIERSGHHNVTVYHRAIYSKSNETLLIYEGGHLNDSIYAENSPNKIGRPIKTLALNDFCSLSGLIPNLIKMDIECAEFDALIGASQLIGKTPYLLLEQQSSDTRCFKLLSESGYIAINLTNYQQIHSSSEFMNEPGILNILYVHTDKVQELPYTVPVEKQEFQTLTFNDFKPNHLQGYTSTAFNLDEGRYLFNVDFKALGTSNNMMCGVRLDGSDLFRYHAYSSLIAQNYNEWIVDVPQKGTGTIYFDFHDNTSDPSFTLNKVKITKFEGIKASYWAKLVSN